MPYSWVTGCRPSHYSCTVKRIEQIWDMASEKASIRCVTWHSPGPYTTSILPSPGGCRLRGSQLTFACWQSARIGPLLWLQSAPSLTEDRARQEGAPRWAGRVMPFCFQVSKTILCQAADVPALLKTIFDTWNNGITLPAPSTGW